jgi:hypothetical protein
MRFLINIGLWFCSAGIAVLWGLVSWNSRLTGDDYCALAVFTRKGFVGALLASYMGWNGRWSGAIVENLLLFLGGVKYQSVLNGFGLLIGLVFGFACFFRVLAGRLFSFRISIAAALLTGLFSTLLVYFATPNAGESLYWLSGAVSYSWALVFLLLGLASLLSIQTSWRITACGVLSFALAAGCCESSALLLFGCLTLVSAWSLLPRRRASGGWKRLVPIWFSCSVAFAILVLAPGNAVRAAAMGHRGSVFEAFLINPGVTWIYMKTIFHFDKIWMGTAFAAGVLVANRLIFSGIDPRRLSRGPVLLILFVSFLVVEYLLAFPASYAAGGPVADRAWFLSSVSLLAVFFCFGVWLRFFLREKIPNLVILIGGAGFFAFLCLVFGYEGQQFLRKKDPLTNYSAAFDLRIDRALRAKAEGGAGIGVMTFEPLPWVKEYYPDGLGPNADDGPNKCLQETMHLPFGVRQRPVAHGT